VCYGFLNDYFTAWEEDSLDVTVNNYQTMRKTSPLPIPMRTIKKAGRLMARRRRSKAARWNLDE